MSKTKRSYLLKTSTKETAEKETKVAASDEGKDKCPEELEIAREEYAELEAELGNTREEKAQLEDELIIANKEIAKRAADLVIANEEKAKRAAELVIANEEKGKRAAELVIANAEKAKRAAELVIANSEKVKRAAVLVIANLEKAKRADELILADKELVYQNEEKAKRAAELIIADVNNTKREAELVIARIEKAKLIAKSIIGDKKLSFQTEEKSKRVAELVIADAEKAKRESELVIANIKKAKSSAELVIANVEKAKRSAELIIANKELVYQKSEKAKRAAELIIANVEKAKRAAELVIANIEKAKRAAESVITNKELVLATERAKLSTELLVLNRQLTDQIEKRKQTELVLRESEEKFRSIMENSADAIFITNQQGKYLYTNKAVTALLGYTSDEMKSKTIADVSPPDKIEAYFKFFNKILYEGRGFIEIELVKKDGEILLTDLNAVILPDGSIYGSCRDITGRKFAEYELIMAKEKAEESDRLKSAFLTNMSHEIRTPMNGILGFAELLKEPDLSVSEQQEYIHNMHLSGERMLNTINSIVIISKIDSGLVDINIKEVNLNDKIEFIYKLFKPEVEIKGLNFLFSTGLPPGEAIIKTDYEKVSTILTNLLSNAIKFTVAGSIEFGFEKKGEYLEFFVKDTGAGIPYTRQKLIFDIFRQGSESLNRGYEGSGLGLSISKSYVEMLCGRIWVNSEEGKGSAFYFTIPFKEGNQGKRAMNDGLTVETTKVKTRKLKILVAEDDPDAYNLIMLRIKKISKEILHAENGIDAVELCRSNPDIDLILMDIQMPKMNGYDAIRQIRLFNKNVIVIAQTAYAFSSDEKMAIDAGCNYYISKPINYNALAEFIYLLFVK